MNISALNSFFIILLISGAIATAVGTVGSIYTNKKINQEKDTEIISLQPRHLTSSQKDQLVAMLSTEKGKIGLASRMLDGESSDFADELSLAFKEADWEIVSPNRSSLNDFPGFLSIFVVGKNLDSKADFISQSLQKIGIDCRPESIQQGSIGGALQPDTIYIVVGRKR